MTKRIHRSANLSTRVLYFDARRVAARFCAIVAITIPSLVVAVYLTYWGFRVQPTLFGYTCATASAASTVSRDRSHAASFTDSYLWWLGRPASIGRVCVSFASFLDEKRAAAYSWTRCSNDSEVGCMCGEACVVSPCLYAATDGAAGWDWMAGAIQPEVTLLHDHLNNVSRPDYWSEYGSGAGFSGHCGSAEGGMALRFRGDGARSLTSVPFQLGSQLPRGGVVRWDMLYCNGGQPGCDDFTANWVHLAYATSLQPESISTEHANASGIAESAVTNFGSLLRQGGGGGSLGTGAINSSDSGTGSGATQLNWTSLAVFKDRDTLRQPSIGDLQWTNDAIDASAAPLPVAGSDHGRFTSMEVVIPPLDALPTDGLPVYQASLPAIPPSAVNARALIEGERDAVLAPLSDSRRASARQASGSSNGTDAASVEGNPSPFIAFRLYQPEYFRLYDTWIIDNIRFSAFIDKDWNSPANPVWVQWRQRVQEERQVHECCTGCASCAGMASHCGAAACAASSRPGSINDDVRSARVTDILFLLSGVIASIRFAVSCVRTVLRTGIWLPFHLLCVRPVQKCRDQRRSVAMRNAWLLKQVHDRASKRMKTRQEHEVYRRRRVMRNKASFVALPVGFSSTSLLTDFAATRRASFTGSISQEYNNRRTGHPHPSGGGGGNAIARMLSSIAPLRRLLGGGPGAAVVPMPSSMAATAPGISIVGSQPPSHHAAPTLIAAGHSSAVSGVEEEGDRETPSDDEKRPVVMERVNPDPHARSEAYCRAELGYVVRGHAATRGGTGYHGGRSASFLASSSSSLLAGAAPPGDLSASSPGAGATAVMSHTFSSGGVGRDPCKAAYLVRTEEQSLIWSHRGLSAGQPSNSATGPVSVHGLTTILVLQHQVCLALLASIARPHRRVRRPHARSTPSKRVSNSIPRLLSPRLRPSSAHLSSATLYGRMPCFPLHSPTCPINSVPCRWLMRSTHLDGRPIRRSRANEHGVPMGALLVARGHRRRCTQRGRWCRWRCSAFDYCAVACSTIHHRLARAQRRRGSAPTQPPPGTSPMDPTAIQQTRMMPQGGMWHCWTCK